MPVFGLVSIKIMNFKKSYFIFREKIENFDIKYT